MLICWLILDRTIKLFKKKKIRYKVEKCYRYSLKCLNSVLLKKSYTIHNLTKKKKKLDPFLHHIFGLLSYDANRSLPPGTRIIQHITISIRLTTFVFGVRRYSNRKLQHNMGTCRGGS